MSERARSDGEEATARVRARDLGIRFPGEPGPLNAITDVAGVLVGHKTIIEGNEIRTGVTAILPVGQLLDRSVPAGHFVLNGNGEMTGAAWLAESGTFSGPIVFTNTNAVGAARDGVLLTLKSRGLLHGLWTLPVVLETWDGRLSDIDSFRVTSSDVIEAIELAHSGPVEEGNVGGGTGMICYEFKGGIGTASRTAGPWTIGALVQTNHGARDHLRIVGVSFGEMSPKADETEPEAGSVIVAIATDAPLLPHALRALAVRGALGVARTGAIAAVTSGDFIVSFTTNSPGREGAFDVWKTISQADLTPLFQATVDSVEEAVINSLIAARTMTGYRGRTVEAIPHPLVRKLCSSPTGSR